MMIENIKTVDFILPLIIGIIMLWIGSKIWRENKIDLIRDRLRRNVKKSDKKAYTEGIGKGISYLGFSFILNSILILFMENMESISFIVVIGIVIGFLKIIRAQVKYNRKD